MKKKTKTDSPWAQAPKRMQEIVRRGAAIEKMLKGPMTLSQFKKLHGPTGAAALCGVSTVTLWRWETKRTKPEGNDARRLAELGVVFA